MKEKKSFKNPLIGSPMIGLKRKNLAKAMGGNTSDTNPAIGVSPIGTTPSIGTSPTDTTPAIGTSPIGTNP